MHQYTEILKEELVTALGCTEPIAIALLAARFANALEEEPTRIKISCSGNIIKNVKSVTVPNTNGQKGIEVATLAGVISKNWQGGLEVLDNFSEAQREKLAQMLQKHIVQVEHLVSPAVLHIIIEGASQHNTASAELIHAHNNIVKVIKNGKTIFEKPFSETEAGSAGVDRSCLNVEDILHFADTVLLEEVRGLLQHQIDLNMRIAEEGFKVLPEKSIAHVIKSTVEKTEGKSISVLSKAKIALASAIEARMVGLSYPVVTNSGSGTQGLCVSIPVIVFARENNVSEEKMFRALVVSNLIANHQKTGIGKLSAYCGSVSATTAAMCGVAYLFGASYQLICKLIVNSLATISGMVCDGAKVSCATKAVTGLGIAYMAYNMACANVSFADGEGLVKGNVEKTIKAVGTLAAKGMRTTDDVLLDIMLD